MAETKIPIYLEAGAKKVFACSLEWPGWARAGKTEEAAIEALIEAAPRYAEVAKRAHKRFPKIERDRFDVVERIPGNATTDFGAPGKVANADYGDFDRAEADRLRDLLQASWDLLDDVFAKAPPTLKKGPRGGGRDRDAVMQHVLGAQTGYARTIGVKMKEPDFGDRKAIGQLREAILEKIVPGGGKPEKGWPVPYFVRRDAWHVLDHAWEIQDKSES
jgi:predicted RNase H-like HicB family nuclease